MKNIPTRKAILKLVIVIYISFLIQNVKCENELPILRIQQLEQKIRKDNGLLPNDLFEQCVKDFIALLPEISFSPNFESIPNSNSITPNGGIAIRATTNIAMALLRSETTPAMKLKDPDALPLIALDLYLDKLDKAIDPSWQWLDVYANVSPPDETPNSAAGMDPEAIADPTQKQKYLDSIKKNQNNSLINGQQQELRFAKKDFLATISGLIKEIHREDWNQKDAEERFCKDEESKKFLIDRFSSP